MQLQCCQEENQEKRWMVEEKHCMFTTPPAPQTRVLTCRWVIFRSMFIAEVSQFSETYL